MLKIEIKEGRLRIYWQKKEEVEVTPEVNEMAKEVKEIAGRLIDLVARGINQNLRKEIFFDMILCNRETFIKTLEEASEGEWVRCIGDLAQISPNNIKLWGYPFSINKGTWNLEYGDFIFLKESKAVSIIINGEWKNIAHYSMKKATYDLEETKGE